MKCYVFWRMAFVSVTFLFRVVTYKKWFSWKNALNSFLRCFLLNLKDWITFYSPYDCEVKIWDFLKGFGICVLLSRSSSKGVRNAKCGKSLRRHFEVWENWPQFRKWVLDVDSLRNWKLSWTYRGGLFIKKL